MPFTRDLSDYILNKKLDILFNIPLAISYSFILWFNIQELCSKLFMASLTKNKMYTKLSVPDLFLESMFSDDLKNLIGRFP